MTLEILNTDLVSKIIEKKGFTRKHVLKTLGEKDYALLRGERLPKDDKKRESFFERLSEFLGVHPSQLVLKLTEQSNDEELI